MSRKLLGIQDIGSLWKCWRAMMRQLRWEKKRQQRQLWKQQLKLAFQQCLAPTRETRSGAIGTDVPTTGGTQKPSASSHVVKLRAPWISAREMKHFLARTLTRTRIVRLSREMASAMMPQKEMGKWRRSGTSDASRPVEIVNLFKAKFSWYSYNNWIHYNF